MVTGNEKLRKIYLKKLFFKHVLVFIDLFYRCHGLVSLQSLISSESYISRNRLNPV